MEYYFMESNSLTHFGIPGMRWGIRRYQNKDGSLTLKGEKKYKIGKSRVILGETTSGNRKKVVRGAAAALGVSAASKAAVGVMTLKAATTFKHSKNVRKLYRDGMRAVRTAQIGKVATIAAGTAAVAYALKKHRDNKAIRVYENETLRKNRDRVQKEYEEI